MAAAWFLVPALLTGAPPLASAHALVLESSPSSGEVVKLPPPRVVLRFNTRIEKALSGVTLTGPDASPVPLPGAVADSSPSHLVIPLPALRPGSYLIRWKVFSVDGHVTVGAFQFTLAPGP